MTSPNESRQARRHRERQESKIRVASPWAGRPVVIILDSDVGPPCRSTTAPRRGNPWADDPYLLFCRCEDDDGDGFHVLVGVDSADMGETLTRDVAAIVGPNLPYTRCELVENDDAAVRAWAEHSVRRRTLLARYREDRR